jgi:hypothetical protein
MVDNLLYSGADVTESGSLNLPEPSGSHRSVMGFYLYLFISNLIQTEQNMHFAQDSKYELVSRTIGFIFIRVDKIARSDY